MIRISKALFAAASLALVATPAAAQQLTSDGFALMEAVKKRDGDKVTTLLSKPSTTIINTRDHASGDSVLHIVTRERDLTWLRFLAGKGARVDNENREGNTALSLAAQIGWAEGAEFLLSRQASVNAANKRGETPLILAVLNRDVPMVRLLLARGADPRKADSSTGYSALDYAKRDARAAGIVKLLEAPATPAKPVSGPVL